MNATRMLLLPSVVLIATWALIGSCAICSLIGPFAFIAAVITWPILIPASAICSIIGCYSSIKEPKPKLKLAFAGMHLLSVALAIVTGFVAYTYGRMGLVPAAS